MDDYSFLLEIANLSIQFYCKCKTDANFLKKKYADFLIKKKDVKKPNCEIFFIKSRSLKAQVKEKKFYIQALSLKNKFRQFNDLLRIVLIYVLNRNSGFILHASSLVKNRFGYVFVGREDTGKSTIRKLFSELVCLGDDSAVVRKVDGQYFLFGSPFYQRTMQSYPNQKVPIKAIFELKQANFNLVKLLSFPENVRAVATNAYIASLGRKSEEKELLLKNSSNFCQKNKVFSLSFKKDRSFWALFKQATSKGLFGGKTDKITKLINTQVLKKLPQGIIWSPAVASWDFLEKCLVINEASWNFEFNGQRQVGQIIKLIASSAISSFHTKLIDKTREQMTKKADKKWIILIEQNDTFTIIDGNHRAIAACRLGKEGQDLNLRLLIGKLPQGKTCPWC